jgi:hypothetical protein
MVSGVATNSPRTVVAGLTPLGSIDVRRLQAADGIQLVGSSHDADAITYGSVVSGSRRARHTKTPRRAP